MIRVQAQLTEEQARALRELAGAEGVSVAELLRRGADHVLRVGAITTHDERRERARRAVGRFSDGPDVAEEHDAHLEQAFGG